MAKTTAATNQGVEAQTTTATVNDDPAVEKVTLDEFCLRLSASVRRPELINGFHYVETKAGRVKDYESAFKSRFDAFVKTPV